MKILYVDLSGENFSLSPGSYGGGGRFAAHAKEILDDFHILAPPISFRDVQPTEKVSNCYALDPELSERIRNGLPLKTIEELNTFDIVVHHHANIHFNLEGLKAKQAVWAVGNGETIHFNHQNLLLFRKEYQKPFIIGRPRVFDVVLGVPVPEFQEYKKEPFIFVCANLRPQLQIMELARLGKHLGIKMIFAGPIVSEYVGVLEPFLKSHGAEYLGIIDEITKIDYLKRARAVAEFHTNPTCATLSAKQALTYGCSVIATPVGEWPEFIGESKKIGFIVRNIDELKYAWEQVENIKQKDCWEKIKSNYSVDLMVNSFNNAFKEICGIK